MPSILIACTANICRSPMAEAMLKRLVSTRPDAEQWHIESAGTWADCGSPSAPLSQLVMKRMGMDISTHQSQPVSSDLIKRFDLILTMEHHHKEGLKSVFKQYSDRIFLISEMIGLEEDISDPIGGDLEDYKETARKLARILTDGLDRIYQLAMFQRTTPSNDP